MLMADYMLKSQLQLTFLRANLRSPVEDPMAEQMIKIQWQITCMEKPMPDHMLKSQLKIIG
jgi:hypothetical protein